MQFPTSYSSPLQDDAANQESGRRAEWVWQFRWGERWRGRFRDIDGGEAVLDVIAKGEETKRRRTKRKWVEFPSFLESEKLINFYAFYSFFRCGRWRIVWMWIRVVQQQVLFLVLAWWARCGRVTARSGIMIHLLEGESKWGFDFNSFVGFRFSVGCTTIFKTNHLAILYYSLSVCGCS